MRSQESVGAIIKQIRIANGLDQYNFAKRIKSTVSALSNWENGRNYPKDDYLIRISKEFNINTDYIMYETSERVLKAVEKLKRETEIDPKYKHLNNEKAKISIINNVTKELDDFSNLLSVGNSIYIVGDDDIYRTLRKQINNYDILNNYEDFNDDDVISFISENLSNFIKQNISILKSQEISVSLIEFIENNLYKTLRDIQKYNEREQ
ncbi:TPA: helix-turn-helix transcriptional regulator [Staphylococcus aureus]|uniref:helix-turn-helix domain-containing protein n=1 Tax=Staphylococcus aureus TaxID=1280 RepID=UPI0012AF6C95|nr:helix-turn-helix transcriptional regulator [Staphylococcus aureus]MRV69261.1 helix-turn-helix domain-containing protein [Staphylococcus aureus]HCW9967883.1 helix-turn-helix transcriptional regulator [Staphylococcus aureus]